MTKVHTKPALITFYQNIYRSSLLISHIHTPSKILISSPSVTQYHPYIIIIPLTLEHQNRRLPEPDPRPHHHP